MKSFVAPERSALKTYPHGPVPQHPSVSLIIPILNEIAYIGELARDLLAQDYLYISEVWLLDGGSTDGTKIHLDHLAEQDTRFKVMDNPGRLSATAINLAFSRSHCDVVMRLDAHARYAPDMVRKSIDALLATGAGAVGAVARPIVGTTQIARAIVTAHKNPLGVAVASFRKSGARGWTDTVWNACYWKHVVDEVGLLRQDLPRAEDNEYNARIRQAGYGIYLSPEIHAFYQPRLTLPALAKQYRQNGHGVARTLLKQPTALGTRHLAPLVLLLSLSLPTLAAFIWSEAFYASILAGIGYVAILIVATLIAARTEPFGSHILLVPVVLTMLHISYGIGELEGLIASMTQDQKIRPKLPNI